MLTEELLMKMGENMEMVLDQMKDAEPGSKEQLNLVEVYAKLNQVQIDNENVAFNFNKQTAAEEEAAKKAEEDAKDKKWKHKMDILGVAVPAGTSLVGLGAVLIYEMRNVITSKAGMRWLGKIIK